MSTGVIITLIICATIIMLTIISCIFARKNRKKSEDIVKSIFDMIKEDE